MTHSMLFSDEARWKRGLFLFLALSIVAGYAFFLSSFFAPAPGRPGIDENAYLVGGKNIVEHHTPGWKPTDDYQFVGHMWFRTKDQDHQPPRWLPSYLRRWLTVHTDAGWYYPKYPVGLPLLNAAAILLGGQRHGNIWPFAISPICMCLALLGMFLLARTIVGSFYGILAMIVLAMGPTSLDLAELPNSHAPALCFVVWGMFFLARWWQSGSGWRGILAGFLLGYAVTIRYSEGLLILPLVIVVLCRFPFKRLRSYLPALLPLLAWAIPVGLLVAFNWFSTGQLTGYDSTGESSGFTLNFFLHKWDFTVYQLYLFGLFLLLPLGIAGLVIMFRGNWRMALLLSLWFIPETLLYTAYYWGEHVPGVGFLRFFLTLFPPLIIAAMWLLRSAGRGAVDPQNHRAGSIVSPLAAAILTAATAAVGLYVSLGDMDRQYRGNVNLYTSATHILAQVPVHSSRPPVVFTDNGMFPQLLQYMQFMADADWYATDVFEPRVGGGFGLLGMFQKDRADQNAPVLIQQARIDYIDSVRKGKTDADFIRDQHRIVDHALQAGRKVYLVTTSDDADHFRRRFITHGYSMNQLDHWNEPCDVIFPTAGERNSLEPPIWNGEPFIHWQPQKLGLYEIQRELNRKSSATRPSN